MATHLSKAIGSGGSGKCNDGLLRVESIWALAITPLLRPRLECGPTLALEVVAPCSQTAFKLARPCKTYLFLELLRLFTRRVSEVEQMQEWHPDVK